MPAKKLTKKTETPEVAAPPAPETMKKAVRKSTGAPKSPAATHKKAAVRTAPAPRVKKAAPAKPAFDANLHHDEIEREAYFLWEARGYAHGNEGADWLQATAIVRARYE